MYYCFPFLFYFILFFYVLLASANARSHHSKVISRGVRYDKEFCCLLLVSVLVVMSFKEKRAFSVLLGRQMGSHRSSWDLTFVRSLLPFHFFVWSMTRKRKHVTTEEGEEEEKQNRFVSSHFCCEYDVCFFFSFLFFTREGPPHLTPPARSK